MYVLYSNNTYAVPYYLCKSNFEFMFCGAFSLHKRGCCYRITPFSQSYYYQFIEAL
jgi:hypothetical protein